MTVRRAAAAPRIVPPHIVGVAAGGRPWQTGGEVQVSGATALFDFPPPYRRATPKDASALARFVDMAGEGLPSVLWSQMAQPGEGPVRTGARQMRRRDGIFSYRNAVVADPGGRPVAAMLGHPLPDRAPRAEPGDDAALSLETLWDPACGTWFVSALAVRPRHRGQGHGTRLLEIAGQLGRAAGCRGLSLAVTVGNDGARRLYERLGFRPVAAQPLEGWPGLSGAVLLLVREGPG